MDRQVVWSLAAIAVVCLGLSMCWDRVMPNGRRPPAEAKPPAGVGEKPATTLELQFQSATPSRLQEAWDRATRPTMPVEAAPSVPASPHAQDLLLGDLKKVDVVPAGNGNAQVEAVETVETYVVQPGDSPEKIAKTKLGSIRFTQALMAANNITDPRGLRPGQVLKIPRCDGEK